MGMGFGNKPSSRQEREEREEEVLRLGGSAAICGYLRLPEEILFLSILVWGILLQSNLSLYL